MDINYIFGVNKQLTNQTKTVNDGIVIGSSQHKIATGTPCLIFEHDKKDKLSNKYRGFALFPFFLHANEKKHRTVIRVDNNPSLIVKSIGESKFLETIKTIETSRLVVDNIDGILLRVKEVGPMSFIINSNKNLNQDVDSVIRLLHRRFNTGVIISYNQNGRITMGPGEQILFAFTLTDIKSCVPIFNPKKSEGVMLHIAAYYPKSSSEHDNLISSFECTMLFSKYSENITNVDGSALSFKVSSLDRIREMVSSFSSNLNKVGTKGDKTNSSIKKDHKAIMMDELKPKSPERSSLFDKVEYTTQVSSNSSTYATTANSGTWANVSAGYSNRS